MKINKINSCARCGKNHINLFFKKFKQPFRDFSHWGICPNTKDPILLKITK